jgi:PAS domain S-box-containing protein
VTDLPSAEILFDCAPCGLVVTSSDGHILKVNATFCTWTGYTPDELVGQRRIQDMLTMGGKVFHQTHWVPLIHMQGSVSEIQLEVMLRDGSRLPMVFNAVRRQHGETTFQELSVSISTDRKKYEQELMLARRLAEASLAEKEKSQIELGKLNAQLSLADKHKDDFVATLGHELRNPISPIAMAASMIRANSTDPKAVRHSAIIERQVKQLSRLVDDLLDVSRISTNSISLHRQHTTLKSVIDIALDVAEPMFEQSGQVLEIDAYGEQTALLCDPPRVAQIVGNLLVNASKYTNKGGKARLTLAINNIDLDISVSDNGIGIAADKIRNIFGLYNQVDGNAIRSGGGMGIGLALVKKLTELHGGSVAVQSDGEGQGSRFTVSLPIVQASS